MGSIYTTQGSSSVALQLGAALPQVLSSAIFAIPSSADWPIIHSSSQRKCGSARLDTSSDTRDTRFCPHISLRSHLHLSSSSCLPSPQRITSASRSIPSSPSEISLPPSIPNDTPRRHPPPHLSRSVCPADRITSTNSACIAAWHHLFDRRYCWKRHPGFYVIYGAANCAIQLRNT